MKTLNQYIQEKLIINKDYKDYNDDRIVVKTFNQLRKIIKDRYDKLGPGTKENPVDFNDIDVSNIRYFYDYKNDIGIFEGTYFKYIDISYWDVSNVKSMRSMFFECDKLESFGDLSYWDVSNVTDMAHMFYKCKSFNQDISSWDVSSVTNMAYMFNLCISFNQDISGWDVSKVDNMKSMFSSCRSFNQDLSKWNVSNVDDMTRMFYKCKSFNQDLSKWNVSKVNWHPCMFDTCPIKEEYKPKFN